VPRRQQVEQGCLQLDERVKILGRADGNAFDARRAEPASNG